MFASILALTLVATQVQTRPPTPAPVSAQTPVLKNCYVTLLRDVPVPAQEPGLLLNVNVREGDAVSQGTVLGTINDRQAQVAKRIAEFEHQSALEKSNSDIQVRYSIKANEVAKSEYEKSLIATKTVSRSISDVELARLRLTAERSVLEIEQAELQRKVDELAAQTKGAELEAALESIDRRQVTAPFDGLVVEVKRQAGEWVQPGDVVARVIQLDKLRVEGYANIGQHRASDLAGRPVLLDVNLGAGGRAQFTGKVAFVDPRVTSGGDFRVVAEVDNRKENGEWLLRSGLTADMAIDTRGAVSPAASAAPAPGRFN